MNQIFRKVDSLKMAFDLISESVIRHDVVNLFVYGNLSTLFREMEESLTTKEWETANKFYSALDRENFILRRSLLRHLVLIFTNSPILYDESGKPYVVEGPFFSHSNKPDCFLYSFSIKTEIGVDIEKIDDKVDVNGIAKCFFSSIENEELKHEAKQYLYFFHKWTKKEAIFKCTQKNEIENESNEIETYSFDHYEYCCSIAARKKIKTMIFYEYVLE